MLLKPWKFNLGKENDECVFLFKQREIMLRKIKEHMHTCRRRAAGEEMHNTHAKQTHSDTTHTNSQQLLQQGKAHG